MQTIRTACPRKEADIQRAICEYLALKGYFFWRNANTPVFDPTRKQFRRMSKYSLCGLPDIIILKSGMCIACECKSPTGRQSTAQKAIEERWVANGGAYILARDVDDLIKWGL